MEANKHSPTDCQNPNSTTHPQRPTLDTIKLLPYTPLRSSRFSPQDGSFFPQGFLRHPALASGDFILSVSNRRFSTHNTSLSVTIICPLLGNLATKNPHAIQGLHQLYLPRYIQYPHRLTPPTGPTRPVRL